MKIITIMSVLLLISFVSYTQNAIIPQPQDVIQVSSSKFVLQQNELLCIGAKKSKLDFELNHLKTFFDEMGVDALIDNRLRGKKQVVLELLRKPPLMNNEESYKLSVDAKNIIIKAGTKAGFWNGMQTLKQIFMLAKANASEYAIEIPSQTIDDFPNFKWRGLMLDVSRHFFSKEKVKKYLDMMSFYKFNVFHWHLSDDQGWRIEIKSLPKLTEVGAWRVERHGFFGIRKAPQPGEPTTYGGFYTQEDVREIVAYAQQRNIMIIPEIDMPGHSTAAIAAYPWLSVTDQKLMVSPGHKFANWFKKDGKTTFEMLVDNTIDPTAESTYEFVEKVMTEISSLFPSEYIHIGGDECYHGYWERSSKCQAFMKKNNMTRVEQLQSYFIKRAGDIITKLGKKMIGWDEILEGDQLNKNTAVMSWRGEKAGIEASKSGHFVVMSPTTYAYLDYTQGDPSLETKIYSSLSLKKSFDFKAVPDGANSDYVLGGQANLWTEQVPNLQHAFYMTYPRAFSIVEKVWNANSNLDWNTFFTKVEKHFSIFDMMGLSICKATYDPIVTPFKRDNKLYLKLTNDVPGNVDIHYTIDNTFPTIESPIFTKDILLPQGVYKVRLLNFKNKKPIGRMLTIPREELLKRTQ